MAKKGPPGPTQALQVLTSWSTEAPRVHRDSGSKGAPRLTVDRTGRRVNDTCIRRLGRERQKSADENPSQSADEDTSQRPLPFPLLIEQGEPVHVLQQLVTTKADPRRQGACGRGKWPWSGTRRLRGSSMKPASRPEKSHPQGTEFESWHRKSANIIRHVRNGRGWIDTLPLMDALTSGGYRRRTIETSEIF